jgi:hypothetical protein
VIARATVSIGAVALGLAFVSHGEAARFAVGIAPTADRAAVVEQLRARGATDVTDLAPIPALAVSAPEVTALRVVPGVRYVERLRSRRQSFVLTVIRLPVGHQLFDPADRRLSQLAKIDLLLSV